LWCSCLLLRLRLYSIRSSNFVPDLLVSREGVALPCKVGFPSVRTPLTPMQTSSPSMVPVWLTITAPKASKGQGERRSERAWTARFIQVERIERGIGSEVVEAKTWVVMKMIRRIARVDNIVRGGFILAASVGSVYRGVGTGRAVNLNRAVDAHLLVGYLRSYPISK
jgi:hypothetical protein